ncbi:MAG: class I SAM-dependent methyltransferase [Elusimicrobia bacterium]|nr:class I SAM-dependent methyltransferase [Elusimicrobiota bacterium]
MKLKNDWHKDFFNNSFYNPASPAAVEKAPSEALFVLRQLKLKKGAALLDLCCGPGRHSVEFAKKGMAVTGYDFSKDYLKEAAARAKKRKVKLRLVRGDMRELKHKNEFDAAVNLFTSFGYFQKFSDDLKVLKGLSRALKPGGRLMIDVVHGDFVRAHFRPRNWTELPGGGFHLEKTLFQKSRKGVFNTWTILIPGKKPASRSFYTRLYDKKSMSAALKTAGLRPLKFWGSFKGRPLTPKRNRLIVLAIKAGK